MPIIYNNPMSLIIIDRMIAVDEQTTVTGLHDSLIEVFILVILRLQP